MIDTVIGILFRNRLVRSTFNSGLDFSYLQHGKGQLCGVGMASFVVRIGRFTRSITYVRR